MDKNEDMSVFQSVVREKRQGSEDVPTESPPARIYFASSGYPPPPRTIEQEQSGCPPGSYQQVYAGEHGPVGFGATHEGGEGWSHSCNMVGPTFRDLAGTANQQSLYWVIIPIIILAALLLLGACAVCFIVRKKRKQQEEERRLAQQKQSEPSPIDQSASTIASSSPFVTQRTDKVASPNEKMRPSAYNAAPFGNVVSSNVPYVVQGEEVRVVGEPPQTSAKGRDSLVYARPPYNAPQNPSYTPTPSQRTPSDYLTTPAFSQDQTN